MQLDDGEQITADVAALVDRALRLANAHRDGRNLLARAIGNNRAACVMACLVTAREALAEPEEGPRK